jgi:hypothetical protein
MDGMTTSTLLKIYVLFILCVSFIALVACGPVKYDNCDEAAKATQTPIHRGEPGYSSSLDRDGDGVACDSDAYDVEPG